MAILPTIFSGWHGFGAAGFFTAVVTEEIAVSSPREILPLTILRQNLLYHAIRDASGDAVRRLSPTAPNLPRCQTPMLFRMEARTAIKSSPTTYGESQVAQGEEHLRRVPQPSRETADSGFHHLHGAEDKFDNALRWARANGDLAVEAKALWGLCRVFQKRAALEVLMELHEFPVHDYERAARHASQLAAIAISTSGVPSRKKVLEFQAECIVQKAASLSQSRGAPQDLEERAHIYEMLIAGFEEAARLFKLAGSRQRMKDSLQTAATFREALRKTQEKRGLLPSRQK